MKLIGEYGNLCLFIFVYFVHPFELKIFSTQMSPKYILTHFPLIGRNEPDRIMLHAAGVDFINQTIKKGEEWQEAKQDGKFNIVFNCYFYPLD